MLRNTPMALLCAAALASSACDSEPENHTTTTDTATAEDAATDVTEDNADAAEDTAPPEDTATVGCTPSELEPFTAARILEVPIDGQPIIRGRWDDTDDLAFVIDSGAQSTTFDLDRVEDQTAFFRAEELDFGTMTVCDTFATSSDLSAADAAIGVNIDVLLGQTVLENAYTYIDYRAREAFLYPTEPESKPPTVSGIGHVDVPYTLSAVPVLGVNLGSTTVSLIADTGSGVTVITQSAFDAVETEHASPLPRLDGYIWSTSSGSDNAFVTRIPTLTLATGATVSGSWAVVVPDDFHIKAGLDRAGIDAQGFLGAPIYQHFLVEIRGPESAFRLWPYDTLTHLDADRWRSVGIDLARRNDRHVIDMIFSPSSAADADIALGDFLTAVDGQDTSGMTGDAVRTLLRGTPGSTRTLTLMRTGTSTPFDVSVQVDDLLPEL